METRHDSVLLEEVLDGLQIRPEDVVVDATLGGAGHFSAILRTLGPAGTLVGIDADAAALARTKDAIAQDARKEMPAVHLVEDNFRNFARILEQLGIGSVSKALFDLGWSGYQLSEGRGFSFQGDEPLLMTYGSPEAGKTAAELVNTLPEAELADILYTYGEERFGRQIARAIVRIRAEKRILSTRDLVDAVKAGTPAWYHHKRTNPATKTFQALRIAVNDEFGAITEGIADAIGALSEGGRIAVITFHSIEDRLVKTLFRDAAAQGKGSLVNKKVIVPSADELARNPRARSAKLRLFEATAAPETRSATITAAFSYA